MRLVRVITRLNRGGPARTLAELEPRLRACGVQTTVIAGRAETGEDDLAPLLRQRGVDVRFDDSLSRRLRLRDLLPPRGLRRLLRELRPDLVHTHTFKAGWLGRRAAFAEGVPAIHTFHGHVFEHYAPLIASRCMVWLERRLATRTRRLVAVAPTVGRDLTERFAVTTPDKLVIIPGIVSPDIGKAQAESVDRARSRLGLETTSRWVGCVARLAKVKAPLRWLAVAADVSARRPDVRFVWVGDGPARAAFLDERRRLGLDDVVHWAGWQDEPALWHRALHVELLVSDVEGLPLSLLEARALKVPVVATGVGGVPDLIRDRVDGRVVPRTEVSVIADAVVELLDDEPTARAWAAAACAHDQSHYAPERLVERLRSLYDDVLREAKR